MPNLLEESPGLIAFVRSVESGSFTAAARTLTATPSSISRSIARLESKLGSRLFLRSTRSLKLTPNGQAFFERVAPLLRDLNNAAEVLATGLSGQLKISFTNELARVLLDSILDRFVKVNPSLSVEIGMSDRFVDVIREGYDVVFRVGNLPSSELMAKKLAEMRMVIVASPEMLSKRGAPTTIEELSRFPFARYVATNMPFQIMLAKDCVIAPTGGIDCDAGMGLHHAALRSIGAAYLMECVVADDIRAGKLVRVMPQLPLPSLPLHAVHAFGTAVPLKVTSLCDLVASELRGFSPPPDGKEP